MLRGENFKPGRSLPRAAVVAITLLLLAAANVRAAEVELPLITVNGQAEISVVPDEVVLTLEVENTDKDLSVAKAQNDASVRRILSLAGRFDVLAGDVKTDYISVDMKYTTDLAGELDADERRKLRREFVGYEVSKTVIVRLADIKRFEEFFSEVLKAGISRVRDVTFRTSQLRKHKDEARALAIRAAKEKATALAREIGQGVGKAHSIREEGEGGSNAMRNNNFRIDGSSSGGGDEDATFAPGMIKITARVVVSFILN